MTAPISISGLGSSLDVEAIIEGLMKVEQAPAARLELRQGQVKARETALQGILAKLETVSGALEALNAPGLWDDVQTVSSSAPDSVGAALVGGAGPGGYQVEVTQLARAEQRTYAFTSSAEPSQLTIGGQTVELAAGASVDDAVAAINSNPETGVFAVAVGGRLVLSSRQTGAAATIEASGSTIAEEAAKRKPGLDAIYSVDGVAGASASNVLTEAIPGVTLTLSALTAGPVTVNVGEPGPDTEVIGEKLHAFVSAYNAAVEAIEAKLTEEPVRNPASQEEANRGVLFGDTALTGLLGRMRETLSESGLAGLGISTGAPSATVSASSASVRGLLTIDETKLNAALRANPVEARAIVSGVSGPGAGLSAVLGSAAGPSGGIAERISAATAEASRLHDSLLELEERLEMREERLKAQFAAMEAALARSKSESEWLQGQLAGLPSASS
jgi:flagellar hook-associated protein 2